MLQIFVDKTLIWRIWYLKNWNLMCHSIDEPLKLIKSKMILIFQRLFILKHLIIVFCLKIFDSIILLFSTKPIAPLSWVNDCVDTRFFLRSYKILVIRQSFDCTCCYWCCCNHHNYLFQVKGKIGVCLCKCKFNSRTKIIKKIIWFIWI